MKISGKLVNIHERNIYPADIYIDNNRIGRIDKVENSPDVYILPGLIDAHVHIESSMITPGAFALAAVQHGTIGTVSDPHEIANVLGTAGVEFMIEDARKVPFYFYFGAPSCVPATSFESNGAVLDQKKVEHLLKRKDIKYLSEMMNFPGVIFDDSEVNGKIEAAIRLGKPVDGHAPALSGEQLKKYINAGISTDHECSTLAEAEEKISLGMKILIREGSAAKNLNALKDLYLKHPEMVMLCSDDLQPEMLKTGHINRLIAQLINEGYDKYDVIRSATINPVEHYGLEAGLLRTGDNADFIVVKDLQKMNVLETWRMGERIYGEGKTSFTFNQAKALNNFNCSKINAFDIAVKNLYSKFRVIIAVEGELLTGTMNASPGNTEYLDPDTTRDILKIVVKDRYRDLPPAIGFINGFGLKTGAFASSIAHDSHNIIALGTNDKDITESINRLVDLKGGLAISANGSISSVQLNIGGIMTTRSCEEIASDYDNLNKLAGELGCPMKAPFMTLSFMALLVIPELKIGDRGLFNVKEFKPVSLWV